MNITARIKRHLSMLCEEIGPRPTGSQENQTAVEYACKELESSGFLVHQQAFDCMKWTNNGAKLLISGKEFEVEPAPYTHACNVSGQVICIHSLEELRRTLITGKIVLLCDTLASEPLMPKSFVFWNPKEHKETIALLEEGSPLAVLTVSLSSENFVPVIEDGDFKLPCGIILPKSISALYDGAAVTLNINTIRTPTTSANVIATYGNGAHKICFSAHIDTKEGTKGALDNASGVAILLALATELNKHKCPYCIEFVLFNGEDYYSNPGEMAYLASYLSHPKEYICAYNIDGVGLKGQNLSYSYYECPKNLVSTLSDLAAAFPELEEIQPWPQGDHMLFASSGIPAIAITSCGIFGLVDNVLHTANDTLELVDAKKLETLVQFLLHVIEI